MAASNDRLLIMIHDTAVSDMGGLLRQLLMLDADSPSKSCSEKLDIQFWHEKYYLARVQKGNLPQNHRVLWFCSPEPSCTGSAASMIHPEPCQAPDSFELPVPPVFDKYTIQYGWEKQQGWVYLPHCTRYMMQGTTQYDTIYIPNIESDEYQEFLNSAVPEMEAFAVQHGLQVGAFKYRGLCFPEKEDTLPKHGLFSVTKTVLNLPLPFPNTAFSMLRAYAVLHFYQRGFWKFIEDS